MTFSHRSITIVAAVVGVLIVVLSAAVFFSRGRKPSPPQAAKLKIWSPLDRQAELQKLWQDLAVGTIEYKQFSAVNYERELLDALASDTGPDIFFIKNTWLGRYFNKVVPVEDPTFYSLRNLETDFVEVVAHDIALGDKIWGLPLFLDTLALVYNRDFLNAAGIVSPPKTWEEFQNFAKQLTRRDLNGKIIRSGAALGLTNVDNFKDIVSVLIFQKGLSELSDVKRNEPQFQRTFLDINTGIYSRPGEDAFKFYLSFASSSQPIWSLSFPDSLQSFAQAQTAMVLAYAAQLPEIKSAGPQLRWAVTALPQFEGAEIPKNYGSFWIAVVSNRSLAVNQAWQLILNMAKSPKLSEYLRATGRPPALRSLIPQFQPESVLGVYAVQGLTAKSWYQGDEEEVERIFGDMIESVMEQGVSPDRALSQAGNAISAVLGKYQSSKAWEQLQAAPPPTPGGFNLFGR